jgi:hypothetical protein
MAAHRVHLGADGDITLLPCAASKCKSAAEAAAGDQGCSDEQGSIALTLQSLEAATFQLVVNVRYLNRGLAARLRAWVAPGGFLLFSSFMDDPDAHEQVRTCKLASERHAPALPIPRGRHRLQRLSCDTLRSCSAVRAAVNVCHAQPVHVARRAANGNATCRWPANIPAGQSTG